MKRLFRIPIFSGLMLLATSCGDMAKSEIVVHEDTIHVEATMAQRAVFSVRGDAATMLQIQYPENDPSKELNVRLTSISEAKCTFTLTPPRDEADRIIEEFPYNENFRYENVKNGEAFVYTLRWDDSLYHNRFDIGFRINYVGKIEFSDIKDFLQTPLYE